MNIEFVPIEEKHLPVVKEIYDYYIHNSTSTFHLSELSIEELKEIIPVNHPKYKSFIIKEKDGDVICGYCYFTFYKKRQAYDRTSEVSIYIKPGYTRKGIGKIASQHIEHHAKLNGIKVLVGIIAGDNKYSIKLMKNLGYVKCAHFKQVGEKFGNVLDVVAYQKIL